MNRYAAHTGMIVQFHYKGKTHVARIEKINPKNFKVMTMDGKMWNAHPSLLTPSTEDFEVKDSEVFHPGTVVLYKDDHFVVLTSKGNGTLHLAKLGGDKNGLFYTGVSPTRVKKVEFELETV